MGRVVCSSGEAGKWKGEDGESNESLTGGDYLERKRSIILVGSGLVMVVGPRGRDWACGVIRGWAVFCFG